MTTNQTTWTTPTQRELPNLDPTMPVPAATRPTEPTDRLTRTDARQVTHMLRWYIARNLLKHAEPGKKTNGTKVAIGLMTGHEDAGWRLDCLTKATMWGTDATSLKTARNALYAFEEIATGASRRKRPELGPRRAAMAAALDLMETDHVPSVELGSAIRNGPIGGLLRG